MSDEKNFIRAILDDPSAAAPRLVYADWLEERGDAASRSRAEYLRTECEVDSLPAKDNRRRRLQSRLLRLRKLVGDYWWRELDWARVEYCVQFEYECPQCWETLILTDNPAVRHCSECQRQVYYCHNARELETYAGAGECVALDSRAARLPLHLIRQAQEGGRLLGRVAPHTPARLPLGKRKPPAR